MSNEKIKDCVFCGHKMVRFHAKSRRAQTAGGYHYFVRCPTCHTEGPRSLSSIDEAIERWNRRTLAAPVASAAPSGELPSLPTHHVPMVGWTLTEAYQQGWKDRAAIAHQPPKEALTDEQIGAIFDKLGGYSAFCKDFGYLQFARAIEAASALNKQLVEALKGMVDEFEGCYADGEPALIAARAALASVGVKGE